MTAPLLILDEAPIRIGARGEWYQGSTPLHPKVRALFERHVRPCPEGGFELHLQGRRSGIEVDDTAFFVRSVSDLSTSGMRLGLSDGSEVAAGWPQLRYVFDSDEGRLYVDFERNGLDCRALFLSAPFIELAQSFDWDGARLRWGSRIEIAVERPASA